MIAAGLLYLGLFALAASMSRHAELLPAHWRLAKRTDRVRLVAWLLVLASLVAALWSLAWPIRLITWIGLTPIAGGIVLLAITYGLRWARITALLAIALVFAGIVSALG
jgi:hypothetical protein